LELKKRANKDLGKVPFLMESYNYAINSWLEMREISIVGTIDCGLLRPIFFK